jgi:hypothetical protein
VDFWFFVCLVCLLLFCFVWLVGWFVVVVVVVVVVVF